MRTLILAFVLVVSSFFEVGGTRDVPDGRLGHPLGTYLTIEGVRVEEDARTGARTLRVDTVNGKKLDASIDVVIENIAPLPQATRCILRGWENATMVGTPPAVIEAAKAAGKELAPASVQPWKFYRYFIMISAVVPNDLKTL